MTDPYSAIRAELARARERYPDFHSSHEGHSIIREELEELWELVRADHSTRPSEMLIWPKSEASTYRKQMRREAIQIAAMAVRFIEDLCDEKEESE